MTPMSAHAGTLAGNAPLLAGGPFHALLRTAHLLGPDGLPRPRAAVGLGLCAWLAGAALALLEAWTGTRSSALAFFVDPSPYAHALVALPVLLGIESTANRRLSTLLDAPQRAGLLDAAGAAGYRAAFERARRRAASPARELLLALGAAALVAYFALLPGAPLDGWSWQPGPDGARLTAAGFWMHAIVGGAVVFLVFRWLHRFLVWSLLLATLARLPLALVPTHPDRAGGLGVLTLYPSVFSGLILAVGATIGAELVAGAVRDTTTLNDIVVAMLAWTLGVLVVFLGPLLPFAVPLKRLRETALEELGPSSTVANRRFLAALRDSETGGPEPNAEQMESLNANYERVVAIQPMPVTRRELVELLIVAALPLAPALLTFLTPAKLIELVVGSLR
jgi:hypothetical protein